MPIEKALGFQNEADFTSRFLVPLLRRLGYSVVAEYHGQREFGKDLVFGEIDRFGEVAYHGLQAKYQDSISQSDSEKLIDDYRQAFRNPFRHPNTGAEHRINTFVVANAGNIADNARDNFFIAATNAEHGGAVRMFDGKALLALDRWATINQRDNIGERLEGLRIELRFNGTYIMSSVRSAMQQYVADKAGTVPAQRLRSVAVSHYLQQPALRHTIDVEDCNSYWLLCEATNAMLQHLAGSLTIDTKVSMAGSILQQLNRIELLSQKLDIAVGIAIQGIEPLAAL